MKGKLDAMTSLQNLRIELVDLSSELVHAWQSAFRPFSNVHAYQGSILEVSTDALVSPANSFGYMDGGLDLLLSEHFGWDLEDRVRAVLLADHDGELPVGEAIIVPTNNERVPWLVSAPTMRVPMTVADTANAYLAMRGILRAIRKHNRENPAQQISSVACSGLGTGTGFMPPERCARQMRYAYDVCVLGQVMTKGGLAAAARNHMDLIDYIEP